MRVGVDCKSLLLQKSVEKFLGKYLSSLKNAHLVVRDYHDDDPKSFVIGSGKGVDLQKPFSKSQLLLALQNRYKEIARDEQEVDVTQNSNANFEILQKRIEMITQEYQQKILEAIKAFYG